ncbi:J domain-containing protein [Bacteroides acidifaciens]|uniref:J domain-containing protein n=1 Tax=Bacteroides acidifaciens TaxID=85831 RepID=A0A3L8A3B0_9BACE|nr:J domain-containing protein [Bacteroides acidifaciens]RLT78459.1 hypothetical protein D7Y07_19070 [Bacteroides acidifaciens]
MKNYYQILGLEEGATLDEIKTAYREYVVKFHPDKHNGDNFFKERFQEVQEAYDYLRTHYTESDEFIYDNEEDLSKQPLELSDIEITCSKNEISEGDTITLSWYSAIPCQANIIIDNGYSKKLYDNVSYTGDKSIIVKRIKGEYLTVTLQCYNQNSEVSKTIYADKIKGTSIDKQIQEDILIQEELDNSIIYQILQLLSFIGLLGFPITIIYFAYASDESPHPLLEHITVIGTCFIIGFFIWALTLAPLTFYFKERIIKKMRDMGKLDKK